MAFKIVVVRGKRAGAELPLDGRDVFVVGSSPDAHLRLPDEGVRPEHVRIFRDDGRLLAMDTSGAGLQVNGKSAAQAELRDGDELAVGNVLLRVGATRAAAAGELRVLKGPDEGKRFRLERRATLGRGTSADFPLLDMKCSREHCALEPRDGGVFLVDLGSTNGTRLNEAKLESKASERLKPGDLIRLGSTVLEFHALGAAGPGAPASGRIPAAAPPPRPVALGSKAFEIDLDDLDATPAAIPIPIDDSQRRAAVTQRVHRPPSGVLKKQPAAAAPTLSGDLEKMGFAQVVQFLNLQQKSGELVLRGTGGEFGLAFLAGNVTDAWDANALAPLAADRAFYAAARLRTGHFEFHENAPPRAARIAQGTLALLMEAMRLSDEATDPGE